jgi:hypothetical protein
MEDYSAKICRLDMTNLQYYTFHPKSERPLKSVIRQPPGETPAEVISNEREALGFSVITVHQMMAKHLPLHRSNQDVKLPLYLATLTRSEKSQEKFKFFRPEPCHH